MALVLLLHLLVLAPLLAIYHLHTHILKGGTRRSLNNPSGLDGLGGIYLRPHLKTWLRISMYLIGFNPFIILVELVLPSDNVHQAEGDPGVEHAGHVDHPFLEVKGEGDDRDEDGDRAEGRYSLGCR